MLRTCRSLFGSRRLRSCSTRAAVKADVVHRHVVDDGFVVDVRDMVDVVDRSVVKESAIVPIPAFVASSDITETEKDPPKKTDLWPPVTGIPSIGLVLPAPISRSPQHSHRREYPGARHPVISVIIV